MVSGQQDWLAETLKLMEKAGEGEVRRGAAKGAETPESVSEDWRGEMKMWLGAARAAQGRRPEGHLLSARTLGPRRSPRKIFQRVFSFQSECVYYVLSSSLCKGDANVWDSRTLIPAAYRPEGLGGAGHTRSPSRPR